MKILLARSQKGGTSLHAAAWSVRNRCLSFSSSALNRDSTLRAHYPRKETSDISRTAEPLRGWADTSGPTRRRCSGRRHTHGLPVGADLHAALGRWLLQLRDPSAQLRLLVLVRLRLRLERLHALLHELVVLELLHTLLQVLVLRVLGLDLLREARVRVLQVRQLLLLLGAERLAQARAHRLRRGLRVAQQGLALGLVTRLLELLQPLHLLQQLRVLAHDAVALLVVLRGLRLQLRHLRLELRRRHLHQTVQLLLGQHFPGRGLEVLALPLLLQARELRLLGQALVLLVQALRLGLERRV